MLLGEMSVDILSHLFSGLSLLLSCKNSLFFITDFWQIRDLQISAPTPWVCLFTVLMLMTLTVFSCCSCFWCRVWGTVASSRAKHWPFPVDWPRHLGRSHLAVKGGARREGFLAPQPFPSDPCVLTLELRCFDPWCSVVSFDTCNFLRLY